MYKSLTILAVAIPLALAAFFYHSPAAAQKQMRAALLKEPVWGIHAGGVLQDAQAQIDLQVRGKTSWLRIAYPPLKLLNNQWIGLGDNSSPDVISALQFTARTASFFDVLKGVDRYRVAFDAAGAPRGNGEIWFTRNSMRPKGGWISFESEEDADSRIVLDFSYNDTAIGAEASRTLADVLAQLQEVADIHNGKPKKVGSLASGNFGTAAFDSDFDHDGLSDALEIFYGTDPGNPDSDDDTFLDGDEVQRGYNPTGTGPLDPAP